GRMAAAALAPSKGKQRKKRGLFEDGPGAAGGPDGPSKTASSKVYAGGAPTGRPRIGYGEAKAGGKRKPAKSFKSAKKHKRR
ncbi:MAG: hypothetical protein ABGY24_05360, partial [bacterium]